MKPSLQTVTTAAALSLALTFSAQAERFNTDGPLTCQGQLFDGGYIATSENEKLKLSADLLNIASGKNLVSDVTNLSGNVVLITPLNPSTDCNDFMKSLTDTGLIKNIEPNYMVGIDGPGILMP